MTHDVPGAWQCRGGRAYRGGVTGWGSGSPEVLSSGHDGPGHGSRLRVAVLVAVSLLVIGLLGYRVEREIARDTGASPVVVLQAGSVVDIPECSDRCLRLPVFNDGSRTVTVTAIGFGHGRVPAVITPTVVHPGTWRAVRFELPRDCTAPQPQEYRSVQVQTAVAGTLEQRSLRMPGGSRLIREHYDQHCPQSQPVTRQYLRGVWALEYARHDQVGRLLMHFGAAGRFSWEPSGHLFDPHRAMLGRYRLARGRLVVTVQNVNLCHAKDAYVWRVGVTTANLMRLHHVRGTPSYCGAPEGEVWVARRVLDDERLPETRARVNGR